MKKKKSNMKTWGIGYEKYKKKAIESEADFWIFAQKIKSCAVKVVIRQLGSGNKHFLSVMGDSVEIDNKNKRNKKSPKK